jgi:hypothetical protein
MILESIGLKVAAATFSYNFLYFETAYVSGHSYFGLPCCRISLANSGARSGPHNLQFRYESVEGALKHALTLTRRRVAGAPRWQWQTSR